MRRWDTGTHTGTFTKKHSKLFEEIIIKSWWVILFFLVCFFAYDRGLHRLNKEENKLRQKKSEISAEKATALDMQEELQRQIASQNDDAWIELVLMRRLGLVAEGQRKVIFSE